MRIFDFWHLLRNWQNIPALTQMRRVLHFCNSFGPLKDPNLITAINERKLEHYRRVWYALTNFSEGKKPFDIGAAKCISGLANPITGRGPTC